MLSLQAAPDTAPLLLLAVGNASRGDDALGPLLAERIEALRLPGLEVQTEYQLQIENALDLLGRRAVLFVDASVSVAAPYALTELRPARDASFSTHAQSPAAVLQSYFDTVGQAPPPSWQLAIRGEAFELGEPLSAAAEANLIESVNAAREWVGRALENLRAESGSHQSGTPIDVGLVKV
ncbi:MAG: hydrogenase maturation protease [Betaproteobacteria bacterium]